MTASTLVEICVDDLDGVLAAELGGADRVELCADLLEGGTTPSIGLIELVLERVSRIGVQIMVRPRGGDFVYSAAELDVMRSDLRAIARAAGRSSVAVGVVFGVLTKEREVDVAAMRLLIEAADGVPVTFHKAIDASGDVVAAYEALRDLGVQRVLTSGGAATAAEGSAVLAQLVGLSADGPAILAGGGVRPANVRSLVAATRVSEVHLRAQVPAGRDDGTLVTDVDIVAAVVAAVRSDSRGDDRPEVVLALDIGGTNLKGAVVDASGRTLVTRAVALTEPGDPALQRVRAVLAELAAEAGAAGFRVVGAGVVTPGIIDDGVVVYASTLEWTDVALGAVLAADLRVPVHIGHDVRSAGLAEGLFGASAGLPDSVFVAIGTGVAASIFSSGGSIVGATTSAGELGHIPAIPGGEACTCGQFGCLEVYMSGAGLARRYLALGGTEPLTAAEISARLDVDPIAASVWADGLRALSLGLTSVTLLLDPGAIVLGGGVAKAQETLLAPLRELRCSAPPADEWERRCSPSAPPGADTTSPAGSRSRCSPNLRSPLSCRRGVWTVAEIIVVGSAEQAGAIAGEAIVSLVDRRPDAVLGVATGSTPLPVYAYLAGAFRDHDVSRVRAFALDEYVGIARDHPESYHSVIARDVTAPLGLTPALVSVPDGQADDLDRAAADYDRAIAAAGGVDIQLLGIGGDAHIGFNEPGSSFASRTRVKTLTPQTRADNARYFAVAEEVPRHALTQGLGTILEARHLILLAFGAAKAEAVALALEGPLSPMVPATAVHLHPHVTVILDEAAAGGLKNIDFYRYVYDNKPRWQGI
jgi:glucokinase